MEIIIEITSTLIFILSDYKIPIIVLIIFTIIMSFSFEKVNTRLTNIEQVLKTEKTHEYTKGK